MICMLIQPMNKDLEKNPFKSKEILLKSQFNLWSETIYTADGGHAAVR